jgi:hypothetical protein
MLTPPPIPPALHQAWPDPGLLQRLDAAAARVALRAQQARDETAQARQDLLDSQPNGPAWLAALAADREQAATGETPDTWAVQRLLTAEPALYARAAALGAALGSRLDALRGRLAGDQRLLTAVQARLGELPRELQQAAQEARDQATAGESRAQAYAALESFAALGREQSQLRALHRWLTGQDTQYDPSGPARVDRDTYAAWRDARETLDPPGEGQRGWRQQEDWEQSRRRQAERLGAGS